MTDRFSDSGLITRVLAEDDRHAFGELVRRHQSSVRAWARRLANGDTALADDVAQESFIRVYRHLAKFQGTAKFSTWLYRITYHVYLDIKVKWPVPAERAEAEEEALTAPEETTGSPEEREALRLDLEKAMRCLGLEERAAIELCFGRGMTHEEAAAVLECPLGTVKTNILRGKEKLKKHLAAWETDYAG